jgi:hypothetical protein
MSTCNTPFSSGAPTDWTTVVVVFAFRCIGPIGEPAVASAGFMLRSASWTMLRRTVCPGEGRPPTATFFCATAGSAEAIAKVNVSSVVVTPRCKRMQSPSGRRASALAAASRRVIVSRRPGASDRNQLVDTAGTGTALTNRMSSSARRAANAA